MQGAGVKSMRLTDVAGAKSSGGDIIPGTKDTNANAGGRGMGGGARPNGLHVPDAAVVLPQPRQDGAAGGRLADVLLRAGFWSPPLGTLPGGVCPDRHPPQVESDFRPAGPQHPERGMTVTP